jgi:hypothetical protein
MVAAVGGRPDRRVVSIVKCGERGRDIAACTARAVASDEAKPVISEPCAVQKRVLLALAQRSPPLPEKRRCPGKIPGKIARGLYARVCHVMVNPYECLRGALQHGKVNCQRAIVAVRRCDPRFNAALFWRLRKYYDRAARAV